MKFSMLFFVMFFSLAVFSQSGTDYYVAAKTGLSMRDKPDVSGKVIGKIPYGTKIRLIENGEERKSIITEGLTGMWQPVKYENKTGYIIDSYLFPWPPPKMATVKEMKNYFTQVTVPFGQKLVIKKGSMDNIEEGGYQLSKQLYKNGAEWHSMLGYEYGSDAYFLPGFNLQQGFLLLRLIPEFRDAFGEKEELPTESRTYKKGEIEYTVKVDKETFGEYTVYNRITLEYQDGANYFLEMYLVNGQLVIEVSSGV